MKYLTIIIILLTLISCENKVQLIENSFEGTWVEKDNFNAPYIFNVNKDLIKNLYAEHSWIKLYKRNGDTLLTETHFDEIRKDLININNDILTYKLISFNDYDTDTSVSTFERIKFGNYLDYVNSKFKMNIEVPADSADQLTWRWYDVSFFIYNDSTNRLNILYHGKKIKVDSLLYLQILKDIDIKHDASALFYIDKLTRINQLTDLVTELSKARVRNLKYVVLDNSNQLCQRIIYCSDIQFNYPDSLKYLNFPPRPPVPAPNVKNYFVNGILVECFQDSITINRKISSLRELKDILINKENGNAGYSLSVFFDVRMTIEKYLSDYFTIMKFYQDFRDKFVQEKFNLKDFNELENEQYFQFRKKFWLRYYLLSSEKRNEILNELHQN